MNKLILMLLLLVTLVSCNSENVNPNSGIEVYTAIDQQNYDINGLRIVKLPNDSTFIYYPEFGLLYVDKSIISPSGSIYSINLPQFGPTECKKLTLEEYQILPPGKYRILDDSRQGLIFFNSKYENLIGSTVIVTEQTITLEKINVIAQNIGPLYTYYENSQEHLVDGFHYELYINLRIYIPKEAVLYQTADVMNYKLEKID